MTLDPTHQRAAELWAGFTDHVGELYELVMADAPEGELIAADGLRYLLRYLAAGITTCVEFDDAAYPEFGALIENRRSWGLDNPDTKYSFTRLEPGAVYTVSGDPGTAIELELQVNSGHFADGCFTEWEALQRWRRGAGTLPLDDSEVSDETVRAFSFTAPPAASYLHLREFFADWELERPAVLMIERHGAPLPPPPLSIDTMAERMELLGMWLSAGASCWADLGRGLAGGEPGPLTPFAPPESATGLGGQAYGMGPYRCGTDEAVVLEFRPPPCLTWSVSLATWFWESADISNRQCSLNSTQAVTDSDGVVRLVLAQRDPGVANWIDAAGHERGTLALRLLGADPDALPTMSYATVRFDQLADRLPDDTTRKSPEQRTATLRRRRAAIVRRYRR